MLFVSLLNAPFDGNDSLPVSIAVLNSVKRLATLEKHRKIDPLILLMRSSNKIASVES
jgi:hypothetical protein